MTYCREEHYRIEKELATRLKSAAREDRKVLYTEIYDELFQRVPYHPMLTRKVSQEERLRHVHHQIRLLEPHLKNTECFLEIGPGDCQLSFAVAEKVSRVFAVDVSNVITESKDVPDNFSLSISDGLSIPLETESVDFAFSDQLIEHLHPDDARQHFVNVHQALRPNGAYMCITPNRLSGPHDVSRYFDSEATGMHLKEYTHKELKKELSSAGFSQFHCVIGSRGYFLALPSWPVAVFETILTYLPKAFATLPVIRTLLAVRLVAYK